MALIPLLVFSLIISGCISGGVGPTTTLTKDITGFNKIDIYNAFDVQVTQGDEYFIEITVDESMVDKLDVRKVGDTLKIGLDTDEMITFSAYTLEAVVVMPDLQRINLSQASDATITGFENKTDFSCRVSGASSLYGDIYTGDIDIDLSGAGSITLTGAAGELDAIVSGASDLDLRDFITMDTYVVASGASDARVNVEGTLGGNLSGASKLTYYGTPVIGRISTSGSSSYKRG